MRHRFAPGWPGACAGLDGRRGERPGVADRQQAQDEGHGDSGPAGGFRRDVSVSEHHEDDRARGRRERVDLADEDKRPLPGEDVPGNSAAGTGDHSQQDGDGAGGTSRDGQQRARDSEDGKPGCVGEENDAAGVGWLAGMPVRLGDDESRGPQGHPYRPRVLYPADRQPAQQQVTHCAATDRSDHGQDGDAQPVHPGARGNGPAGDGECHRPDVFENEIRIIHGNRRPLAMRVKVRIRAEIAC